MSEERGNQLGSGLLRQLENELQNPKYAVIKELGILYGYPDCCIAAFINDVINLTTLGDLKRDSVRSKYAFDGFVPCLWHANELLKKDLQYSQEWKSLMIGAIARHRQYPYPFPIDHEDINDIKLALEGWTHDKKNCTCKDCQDAIDYKLNSISHHEYLEI